MAGTPSSSSAARSLPRARGANSRSPGSPRSRAAPPAEADDVLAGELVVGHRAARLEGRGADQEEVVDHAVVAGRVTRLGNHLVPDVRRVGVDLQPHLFAQLPAQRGLQGLPGLDAAAGRRPHHDRPGGPGDGEPAQQDAVVLVEDERADRVTQVRRGHPHMLRGPHRCAARRSRRSRPAHSADNSNKCRARRADAGVRKDGGSLDAPMAAHSDPRIFLASPAAALRDNSKKRGAPRQSGRARAAVGGALAGGQGRSRACPGRGAGARRRGRRRGRGRPRRRRAARPWSGPTRRLTAPARKPMTGGPRRKPA